MYRRAAAIALAIGLTFACTDERDRPEPPTAPAAASIEAAVVPVAPRSSICLSFDHQLAELKKEAAEKPEDKEVAGKVKHFQGAVQAACR